MQKWEYCFVTADTEKDQWRARHVNDRELSDWKKGPTMSQYANQLGEEGWELVCSTFSGGMGYYKYVFKRAKA